MESLSSIKEKIIPILKKHHINNASIVGSYATEEQTENSDIDIIVEIDQQISLLSFARIKIELEEILGKKVDLIERTAIKPRLKKHILRSEINIF